MEGILNYPESFLRLLGRSMEKRWASDQWRNISPKTSNKKYLEPIKLSYMLLVEKISMLECSARADLLSWKW
jgi:hypothetical protein